MLTNKTSRNYLSLDIGEKRIGVARASSVARLAEPLDTLDADTDWITQLKQFIAEESVGTIVVGLPRNLQGEHTEQTRYVEKIVEILKQLDAEIVTIDEAGTSVEASRYMREKHRPKWSHESVDAFAAMIILQDYLDTGVE